MQELTALQLQRLGRRSYVDQGSVSGRHPADGLVIGVVEALSGFYLPEGFKDVAPYVVVLIMLVVRPNGLFGEKLRKKV